MAKMFYDSDADLNLLKDKSIAVIGYGSQGHAHALSAHDSGIKVRVGLYKGSKSWEKAEKDGLEVGTVDQVTINSDIIMLLLPRYCPTISLQRSYKT
jgi:Ketol-acid reductoisomerase